MYFHETDLPQNLFFSLVLSPKTVFSGVGYSLLRKSFELTHDKKCLEY
jgi:hypothetical protein